MVVLALETATRQGSIALWIDGRTTARLGDPQRTHGERLPVELLDWLADHDRTVRDVDLYAVVSGPGSFTGLRILPAGEGHAFHRSRETQLLTDRPLRPRVLSIYGGKLTGYRATAEQVLTRIGASLPSRAARADTRALKLPAPD